MKTHGPRIIFKDDRDSSIGRGCVLYAGHMRPEAAVIVYEAAQTAPDELEQIVISEGWRQIRPYRDLHEELRAFDLSLNGIHGDHTTRLDVGLAWAVRLREALGPDYEIVVHGSGTNLHLHCELDP